MANNIHPWNEYSYRFNSDTKQLQIITSEGGNGHVALSAPETMRDDGHIDISLKREPKQRFVVCYIPIIVRQVDANTFGLIYKDTIVGTNPLTGSIDKPLQVLMAQSVSERVEKHCLNVLDGFIHSNRSTERTSAERNCRGLRDILNEMLSTVTACLHTAGVNTQTGTNVKQLLGILTDMMTHLDLDPLLDGVGSSNVDAVYYSASSGAEMISNIASYVVQYLSYHRRPQGGQAMIWHLRPNVSIIMCIVYIYILIHCIMSEGDASVCSMSDYVYHLVYATAVDLASRRHWSELLDMGPRPDVMQVANRAQQLNLNCNVGNLKELFIRARNVNVDMDAMQRDDPDLFGYLLARVRQSSKGSIVDMTERTLNLLREALMQNNVPPTAVPTGSDLVRKLNTNMAASITGVPGHYPLQALLPELGNIFDFNALMDYANQHVRAA